MISYNQLDINNFNSIQDVYLKKAHAEKDVNYLHGVYSTKVLSKNLKSKLIAKRKKSLAQDIFKPTIEKEEIKDKGVTDESDRKNVLLKSDYRNQSEEKIEDIYDEIEKISIEEHDKIHPFTVKDNEFNESKN